MTPPDLLASDEDRYDVYRVYRDEYPCFHDEASDTWFVSRYADVEHVFKNPTFSTDMYEWMIEPAHGPTLLSKHGAEHSRYRNLVAPFFRGAILESDFMPMIEAQARSMIDQWHADGSCDLVEGLSRYMPIKVIVAMLGLPDEDHPKFQAWYESINRFVSNINQDPDIIAEGEQTRVEFQEYLMPVIAERRRNPGHDLLSNLVTAEIDGSGLSDIEVKSFTSLLLTAGGETTDKAIASLFKNLLEHPDQLEQVRSDRSLVTMAVAETLRYSPPAHWIQRLPHEEAELPSGTGTIPAGATVTAIIGAANRDERKYTHTDPELFDINRQDLPASSAFAANADHTTFSFGRHHCVGSYLAKAEIEAALNIVLDCTENLRLADGFEAKEVGVFLRAPAELHVEFDPVEPN